MEYPAKENPDLRFLKVLINGLDKRMNIHKAIYDNLLESFDPKDIFDTVIPTDTQFSQAEFLGQTIFEHAKASPGARAYRGLAAEITNIIPPARK